MHKDLGLNDLLLSSFLPSIPEFCWTIFSGSDHRKPSEVIKIMYESMEGERERTAPSETGGTTASIKSVRVGER